MKKLNAQKKLDFTILGLLNDGGDKKCHGDGVEEVEEVLDGCFG